MMNYSGCLSRFCITMTRALACLLVLVATPVVADAGVSTAEIRLGTVLDLEGRSKSLGQNMLQGMQAALQDKTVGKHKLVLLSKNDSYTPEKTVAAVKALIAEDVFLFMGNVGTPTASVALPLLKGAGIPAFGFFTGSGILRPDQPEIINYRASYRQETEMVIQAALAAGIKPTEVCAYVQNDAYGMSGIQGIQSALNGQPGIEKAEEALATILAASGETPQRNGIGPVGVYVRNTFRAREGYDSLKQWEKASGVSCRLIVTVGSYNSIGNFIAYAESKGEPWIYSAVSFTGAEGLLEILLKYKVTDRVMITQVVPGTDSDLPVVAEARAALGKRLNLISLEGFIVGKLLLSGLETLNSRDETINRENFLKVYQGQQFDLGGLKMDFSEDNQGADFVGIMQLDKDKWITMNKDAWRSWLP